MERAASFARGLMAQFEVVHALALRETRTRFGKHQMGYVWALLEPSLMILTFVILFLFANRPPPEGMGLFGFIATGILPYSVFINSLTRVAESINGNRALLFYPHVQPLDLVFARGLLEFATYAAVFIILLGGDALYHQELDIGSPLMVVVAFALASMLGTAAGLVFCGLGQFSSSVDRARGPLLRPLFWISGVFFTANQMPDTARHYLLHNPLLHVVELLRDGWYPNYEAVHARPGYTLAWILGLSLAGLSLERVVRRRIEVT